MANIQTTLAALERSRENCARLLLMCQEVILNPTGAAIDALVAAATTAGAMTPKPSYSVDGESYQWEAYQMSLISQMDKLTDLIAKMSGPYEIRSRAL